MPCTQRDGDWWRDKETLLEELAEHGGSNTKTARHHGLDEFVIRKWRKRHSIPPSEDKGAANRVLPREDITQTVDDSWLLVALKKRGDNATVEDLADYADVSPKRVRDALDRLGHGGYRVAHDEGRVTLHRVPPPTENQHRALFAGETYRFAALGDTHLSSKHERLDELHMAYDLIQEAGISDVYHVGDLVCGYGIFKGQNLEVQHHTYQEQVDYAALNYPQRDGITTRIISGNHDCEGDFGKAGANPVIAVCNQREDMEYLGDYQASIEFDQGTRMYLLHPAGPMGYAIDYKARKLVEGFEAGRKPNVMLCGHYHRSGWFLPRGVHVLFTACFESGGSFGPRRGLADPVVGFFIVEMTLADDSSVVKFNQTFHQFFPGREAA